MAVTINEGTQTDVYTVNNGGTEIQVIKLDIGSGTSIQDFGGSIVSVGTVPGVGSISNVAVIHNAGSIAALPDLPGGTIDSIVGGTLAEVGSIGNIGMIHAGTVTTSLALNSGTITTGSLSNIAMLHAGTVAILGTVPVSGASAGTDVNLVTGTVTTGSLANIAVIHNAGTVAALPTLNLTTGTITTGSITNLAMIHAGTLTSSGTTTGVGVVSNLTNGSINILTGTLQSAGTTTGVGVVSNLTMGSVRMTVGTLTTGSLSNVAMVNAGTFVQASGTLTTQASGTLNTLGTVGAVNSIVAGTQNTLGTVAVVNNIVTGTLASVTLNNKFTGSQILVASALGTAGGSLFGTLSAASGAGTSHFVTGLQIVMNSGTADVYLGFGTSLTGGSVLARGRFTPGGGIMRDFTFPIQSGTNSEICYEFAGAGTAFIAVNYWKGV